MRIAIVGAGNAGCITALHYHKYLEIDNEIVIYHSPEQHPIERVGQGTILTVSELIGTTIDTDFYNNKIGATIKSGILYENWGKKQGRDPDLIYTRSVATPNGWTFVIPNVDSVSYGYMYNNNIT